MERQRDGDLKLLLLEDREEDFYIISRALRRDGLEFEAQRVDSVEAYEQALLEFDYDLIISDFNLPGFSALQALDLLRESRPEVPFIVVSGSIGEEQAVELIRHGAADFLMKDRLARLPHVVRRELREAVLRERQRSLEREIRHLQRIETLGSLAGGIAHNFRNVLMAVRGLGELATEKLPGDHPAAQDISQLLEATGRSEQLVNKLLRFSRREASELSDNIDLHSVISSALAMLRPTLPSMLSIHYAGQPSAICQGFADEVEQIILNLCNNAAQAIGQRPGRITLLLDRQTKPEPGPGLLPPGHYLRLRVIDDGPGMNQQVLDNIFEPFFTTKPAGEGTGLGLAMVQRAMTEMGGAAYCESEPGHGTTFTLYFPGSELAESSTAHAPLVPGLGQGESILLVDDEQILANLAAAFLSQGGYRVTKFYDPASALGAFRAEPLAYDLLLTDLAMPGMTGLDLADAMRALRPGLPVVLCTGYGGDPGGVMQRHCDVVLAKPCGRVELYEAVRRALELRLSAGPELATAAGSYRMDFTSPA